MHKIMQWNCLNACYVYKCDGSLGKHLLGEQKLGFIQWNLGNNVGRWPQLTAINWNTGNLVEPHSWMGGVISMLDIHWPCSMDVEPGCDWRWWGSDMRDWGRWRAADKVEFMEETGNVMGWAIEGEVNVVVLRLSWWWQSGRETAGFHCQVAQAVSGLGATNTSVRVSSIQLLKWWH